MNYISPNFHVGQTVYWYDDEEDAVCRGVVTEISALSRDATKYGGGSFEITYSVDSPAGTSHYPEAYLNERPTFPPLAEAAVPAPAVAPISPDAPELESVTSTDVPSDPF